jgi:hypothetical protein
VEIVPHSALVTTKIEQADPRSMGARRDVERPRQQQQRIDEPLNRDARLAVADLSPIAASDGRLGDPPARTNLHLVCPARSGAVMTRRPSSAQRSDR